MANRRVELTDCIKDLERTIEEFELYHHDIATEGLEELLKDLKTIANRDNPSAEPRD